MTPSELQADRVVEALVCCGVRRVVLCPGSRSAPLAYRLEVAEQAGDVRLWVRHDERSAGFVALGMARAGAPAAVVTTSGTAVANLHPAVLEAHHGGVPLIVVSADRPLALRGTWANQTTELQPGLFGGAVRARTDGGPDAVALEAAIRRGLGGADARPGPVHLNVCLAEPLVPRGSTAGSLERSLAPAGARVVGEPAADSPITALGVGPRTVVVAGDGAGPAARTLAAAAGWPLFAEPSSGSLCGAEGFGPYRLLLEHPGLAEEIERVVVFGRPTLSRPVTRLLQREDVEVLLVSPYSQWPIPDRPVRRAVRVRADGEPDRAWWSRWRAAARAARGALDAVLDAGAKPTGPRLARAVARSMAPGAMLMVAASNPVRDLDLVVDDLPTDVTVVANRGLAGIDGTLSTATGYAAATDRSTRVLVGDLAFLHDANALLAPPGERRPPVQAVVLNDGGGGIFSMLEYGELAERDVVESARFERLFGTPQRVDLEALCRAHGVGHVRIEDMDEVRDVLARPEPGFGVVEVAADRSGLRRRRESLRAAVAHAVDEVLVGSADRSPG